MPLSHTPVYNLPYIDSNTPLHELDEATKGMAEGIETVFGNAQFPPGNPDLNDVLLRLNKLEARDARTPYAVAAGAANCTVPSNSTSGAVAISFPAGRFNVAPLVTCAKQDGTNADYVEFIRNISTTGCEIVLFSKVAGGGGVTRIAWNAVQMTATSAAG